MGNIRLLTYSAVTPSVSDMRANGFHWLTQATNTEELPYYLLGAQQVAYLGVYILGNYAHRVIGCPNSGIGAYLNTFPSLTLASEVVYYTSTNTEHNGYYYSDIQFVNYIYLAMEPYNDLNGVLAAFDEVMGTYPITYRLTNCTAPDAPERATVGNTVTVPLTFTSGYGIVNPSTDVYVTNNGVAVPSTYTNGVLTFTMPNPS